MKVALFGNSHTADNGDAASTYSRGVWTWANTLLGWDVASQKGVVNDTVAQMLARLDADLLACHPDAAVMLCLATNSINQKVPTATVIAQLDELFRRVEAAGIRIITSTDIPRASFTAAQKAVLIEVNAWIKAQGCRHQPVADFYARAADDNGNAHPLWLRDGTHMSPLAAGTLGREVLAPLLTSALQPVSPGLLAGLTPTVSKVSGAGSFEWADDTLHAVYPAAVECYQIKFDVPRTLLAVGNKLVFEADLEVQGDGVRNVGLRVMSGARYADAMHASSDPGQYGDWAGRLKTIPMTLTSTAFTASVVLYSHAPGACSVRVVSAGVSKV